MNEKNYKKDIIKNEEVKKPKYESLSEDHYHKSHYKKGYELTLQEDFDSVIFNCYYPCDFKNIKDRDQNEIEHIHRFLRFFT